jgi:2-hydroxycyclohexanecarboxyl-CoA dehydrogenase
VGRGGVHHARRAGGQPLGHAFPHLRESPGATVVNFGSAAGYHGQIGIVAYNATKEAIRALSRTAAREWGQYGITVNIVVPAISTDSIRGFFADKPELYEQILAEVPLRRLGDPFTDAGGLVSFLAGPDARYITGMSIELDGGHLMHP